MNIEVKTAKLTKSKIQHCTHCTCNIKCECNTLD